jgi:hypothetical protein
MRERAGTGITKADEHLTGLALTEWRRPSSSLKSLMNGQFGAQNEPLHDTLLKMKKNKDWHRDPAVQCINTFQAQ